MDDDRSYNLLDIFFKFLKMAGAGGSLQQTYFKLLLFAGLLLSETQLLVNLKFYALVYTVPYFTVVYFVFTTIHLALVFVSYGFWGRWEKGTVLEWYQHVVLPLSVLLLSLLSKNQGMVEFKTSCALLLAVQSLLVAGKIVYFNSVTPELAQISTINKLLRVVKLNIIGLVPLLVDSQLVVVVVVGLCQAVALCAFFLKFTYQKCLYEYVLLVGVLCGFISAVENVFETVFQLQYLFIGQLAALFFLFYPHTYLRSALELKYTSALSNTSEAKQDDELLAGLLFVEECLFEGRRSLRLSEGALNEGAVQATTVLERARGVPLEGEPVFGMRGAGPRREVSEGLFQAYCLRFHQTDSFSCFEFTVGSALQLGGNFTFKALILYYGFMQRKKAKTSVFEGCKFAYLYQRILKQIDSKQSDKQDINFIEFSDNLRLLAADIEDCLSNELKLAEYLADRSRKAQMLTDGRLMARAKVKGRIRQRMERCIAQGIYFCSNQFKFLFLLYHVSVEKRFLSLRQQLKKHFLASEVQGLRWQGSENSLIVLAGFNHGQILNSNQVFKSHFGLALSSFARTNISQFIPTQRQRARHNAMMAEIVQFRTKKPPADHSSYICHLAIQRQFGAVKLKVVEAFTISVRIYYENSGSFNYICSLATVEQVERGKNESALKVEGGGTLETLTLLRRDCDNFSSKGIQFSVVEHRTVAQLEEHLELAQVAFAQDIPQLRVSGSQYSQHALPERREKERAARVERYLQEKTGRIQEKLVEEGGQKVGYHWGNIVQVFAVLSMGIFLMISVGIMGAQADNLKQGVWQLLMPAATAQLVHNRILLEQEILSLQAQTPYFPDNICGMFTSNITKFIINIMWVDLGNNTDQFIQAISLPKDLGPLSNSLYTRQFISIPYLKNPSTNTSYQKHIQLMKSQTYSWSSTLRNSSFDTTFYSQTFPGLMQNSTIDGSTTLTAMILVDLKVNYYDLYDKVNKLGAVGLVVIAALGVLAVVLRVRDNRRLMHLLGIVESIPSEQLTNRIRELKSALAQLHQVRTNRIESIEFDHAYQVEIRSDKRPPEAFPVEQFADWHIRSKAEFQVESEASFSEDDKEYLQQHGASESLLMRSPAVRLLHYKRWYLFLAAALVVCVMILSDSLVDMLKVRLNALAQCSEASLQLLKIQQKFINLISYNWLKVLSLQQTSFDMTAATLMYNQGINSLLGSDYQAKIRLAYSKDLSDRILYGNICSFFTTPSTCTNYRNNLFSSGFSMLIPFVAKEMVQIDQISSNYTYYTLNMCDKTTLLFNGIIPLTANISAYGFSTTTAKTEEGFVGRYLQIAATVVVLLVVTVLFQRRRQRRETIISEEVFSLETVQNLYSVAEFKPYFNKIYYS